ncbi:MAG: nucleotidyltransferase family protein [Bacillaceae bacterium]
MLISFLECLYSQSSLPTDEQTYHQLIDDIEFSNVSAQIYQLLKNQNRLEQTPNFFQVHLKKRYQQILLQNMALKKQTDDVLRLFEQACIPIIPLKGVYFAQRYFEDIGARCTTDIDVLIQKENYEQAVMILKNADYDMIEHLPDHFHANFLKKQGNHSFSIELHWNIGEESQINIEMADFWEAAEPLVGYMYAKQLSDYHTLHSICLHGWSHQLASARYLIDIVQLIHQIQWNEEQFFLDAKRYKTWRRMQRTLAIVYESFPHLANVKAISLKKKAPLWWREAILNADSKRGETSKIKTYMHWTMGEIYHCCLDGDTLMDRLNMLKNWFIPNKARLEYLGFQGYTSFYTSFLKKAYGALKKA